MNGVITFDYLHLKDLVEELGGDISLLNAVLDVEREIALKKEVLADYTDAELEEMRYKG